MNAPRILDLFSGPGGAGKGYADAGFTVVGADIEPQPHYPYEFYQDDALNVLETLLSGGRWHGYTLHDFKAVHASPVCKSYTICNLSPKENYPKQIAPVRERLLATGLPYIIENVMGAKRFMQARFMLCGTMFGLPIQRHRLFETNVNAWWCPPRTCVNAGATIGIYGHSIWDSSKPGTTRKDGRKRADSVAASIGRDAMGISWMNKVELAQAIPPAYTRWIGERLLAVL